MSKKKHGGKRVNAGRKPISDPKITIVLYISKSIVDQLGGKEKLQNAVYNWLTDEQTIYNNNAQ